MEDFIKFVENSGGHDLHDGVIIVAGKNIKTDVNITGASVLDITPTILYLLGLPVAKDMDGKVLVQAIDPSYLQRSPIRYIESYDQEEKTPLKPEKPMSTPYDEQLLERLRSLGYIQ